MTSDSDLKGLVSSQDLNFIFDEDPTLGEFVNGNMGILQDAEVIPEQYSEVPPNEDYKGIYNFETIIDPRGNKSLMYSDQLNKAFVISHTNFVVDFKWENPNSKIDFYVRAMPLYSSPQDAHKPVTTCVQHRLSDHQTSTGLSKFYMYHILRCINDQAQYAGGPDCHLSVLVPLGVLQAGMETVRHTYYFVCKNSCTPGMNRRAIEVVFTLEDVNGVIYGRKKISFRICSCPKRDKAKEEEEHLKNNGQPILRGKKRKIITNKKSSFSDPNDTQVYTLNIQVAGKRNARSVLKHARGMMAAEIHDRGNEEPFETCFNDITNLLKSYD